MSELRQAMARHRVVPVVVLDDPGLAPELAQALCAGGLPIAELTLRTPSALAVLAELAAQPGLLVGAGTVLTAAQVDDAVDAGARFVVSPGLSPAVLARAAQRGVPAVPGVATASELMTAMDLGVQLVKLFPAQVLGGLAALSALAGPFPQVRFVPTGGVGPGNAAAYLAHPAVLAVGGSWMVSAALLAARDFATIQELTAQAVALVGAAA